MHQVTIHEAKTQLSKLIQEVIDGQEVIIARGNKPVVRLEVLSEARRKRRIGEIKNLIIEMKEDFNDPLDDFADYLK